MHQKIEIEGDRVCYKQDGREVLSAPLGDFIAALAAQRDEPSFPEAIPEGVRFFHRRGSTVVLVMEERPQARTVRWLAHDSPAPFGPGAHYRTVRLAFPFVVLVVAFHAGELTGYQQCFYRASPLSTLSDPLLLPNLYNVAEGYGQKCWVCLPRVPIGELAWKDKVETLRQRLWGSGFNRSAEIHEGMSYWQAMRGIDRRLRDLIAWEEASRADPFFPLKVKWLPAHQSVGEVVQTYLNTLAPRRPPSKATDLVPLLHSARTMKSLGHLLRSLWAAP